MRSRSGEPFVNLLVSSYFGFDTHEDLGIKADLYIHCPSPNSAEC